MLMMKSWSLIPLVFGLIATNAVAIQNECERCKENGFVDRVAAICTAQSACITAPTGKIFFATSNDTSCFCGCDSGASTAPSAIDHPRVCGNALTESGPKTIFAALSDERWTANPTWSTVRELGPAKVPSKVALTVLLERHTSVDDGHHYV